MPCYFADCECCGLWTSDFDIQFFHSPLTISTPIFPVWCFFFGFGVTSSFFATFSRIQNRSKCSYTPRIRTKSSSLPTKWYQSWTRRIPCCIYSQTTKSPVLPIATEFSLYCSTVTVTGKSAADFTITKHRNFTCSTLALSSRRNKNETLVVTKTTSSKGAHQMDSQSVSSWMKNYHHTVFGWASAKSPRTTFCVSPESCRSVRKKFLAHKSLWTNPYAHQGRGDSPKTFSSREKVEHDCNKWANVRPRGMLLHFWRPRWRWLKVPSGIAELQLKKKTWTAIRA